MENLPRFRIYPRFSIVNPPNLGSTPLSFQGQYMGVNRFQSELKFGISESPENFQTEIKLDAFEVPENFYGLPAIATETEGYNRPLMSYFNPQSLRLSTPPFQPLTLSSQHFGINTQPLTLSSQHFGINTQPLILSSQYSEINTQPLMTFGLYTNTSWHDLYAETFLGIQSTAPDIKLNLELSQINVSYQEIISQPARSYQLFEQDNVLLSFHNRQYGPDALATITPNHLATNNISFPLNFTSINKDNSYIHPKILDLQHQPIALPSLHANQSTTFPVIIPDQQYASFGFSNFQSITELPNVDTHKTFNISHAVGDVYLNPSANIPIQTPQLVGPSHQPFQIHELALLIPNADHDWLKMQDRFTNNQTLPQVSYLELSLANQFPEVISGTDPHLPQQTQLLAQIQNAPNLFENINVQNPLREFKLEPNLSLFNTRLDNLNLNGISPKTEINIPPYFEFPEPATYLQKNNSLSPPDLQSNNPSTVFIPPYL
jgi:hypothetical protein